MNAKKAKALRKIARTLRHPLSGGYKEIARKEKLLPTGKFLPSGLPEYVRYTPVTVLNDVGGLRGAYRELKKAAAK